MNRVQLLPLSLFLLALLLPTVLADEGTYSDQRFLAGLRQRGLYWLAEAYCTERLERPDLPQSQRAELVVELSRSLAEQAASSPAEARQPLWQRASQVTEDFALRYPQDSNLPLVRFQQALTHLARGELARQEAELLADNDALLKEAREQLQLAIRQLSELAEQTDHQLQSPHVPDSRQPTGLTPDQLQSLKKNIQYQLARALRNQGQSYPIGSPDQADSLTRAVRIFSELAGLDPASPLAWDSRLERVVCNRLLADYATARQQLDALLREQPPPAIELRARAEQIHLALAENRLSEALSVLSQGRLIAGVTSAELDYAWLMTYLWAAGDARNAAQAAQWQAKATEMLEAIEQLHGSYWTRRGGMLLSRYVQASSAGGDLEMLVRAAESSFRSGRLDDALAAYDAARILAAKQGQPQRAFDLGYIAATIEHQRDRHAQASARYRQIALAMPEHPQAADAHLLAIHHAAQVAKQQPQSGLQEYEALLQEHLRHWPHGPTAEQVRLRLGRLLQHRQEWQQAIDAYRAVSPQAEQYPAAVEAVEDCYRRWLAASRAAGQPTGQLAAAAADWFESQLAGPQGRLPESWSPAQRAAALAAARMRMDCVPADYGRAESILAAALQGSPDAPPQWQSAARALMVCALAGQGRRTEAGQLLAQVSSGPPGQLLEMLQGLKRAAETASPEVQAELANLQMQVLELLQANRDQLSASQQQDLLRTQAEAKTAQEEAEAKTLLAQNDRKSVQEALRRWRDLEKKSPPGSPRWYRAKYSLALAHYRLGNKQQAAKIIQLLQLLHPDCGGPQMKAQFDELLRHCQQ